MHNTQTITRENVRRPIERLLTKHSARGEIRELHMELEVLETDIVQGITQQQQLFTASNAAKANTVYKTNADRMFLTC